MTRENSTIKYTAIILCILLALSSWSTFVCVSESSDRNTQFFAVNLYLAFFPVTPHSMGANTSTKVVSWMKKPEIFPDNPTFSPEGPFALRAFSDKHDVGRTGNLQDIYTSFKSTSFFLRI